MRMAIESFAKSYDADPTTARPLLDRLLDPARISRLGQFEIEPLASNAENPSMGCPSATESTSTPIRNRRKHMPLPAYVY